MMKKVLLGLFGGLCMIGCASEPITVTPDGSRQSATTANYTPTRTVGTGSGDLSVDGRTLGIRPGEIIAIAPGKYSSITFSNLIGLPYLPSRLVANGLVEVIGGSFELNNVSYLTVDGGATKNLYLHDIPYRGIIISGSIPHSLTLQGMRVKNVGDYALYYNNSTTYNKSDATAFTGFRLLFCDFDNVGSLQFRGEVNGSSGLVNYGFMKNPEVAYCSFNNCPTAGTVLYIGNAENLNIHHNYLNNINTQNNNHNGIFHLIGNGSVHHNKCTNHQGNFVRFWPVSQGLLPKDVLIHDNIVWNSRKYSGFELQSFAGSLIPGVSTYCNANVYNNTVGRMNTSLPTVFVGVVVDVYNLYGGRLQIVNNLSFDQVKSSPNDGIWSQQSVTRPSVYSNNLNFSTLDAAGLVDKYYFRLQPTSSAKGKGMVQAYELDDFYGSNRGGTTPSVGAVE